MAAPPPVPPPPPNYYSSNSFVAPPPPPPLPPSVKALNERYSTPSQYELDSLPHFENPMIAPRPHRVDPSIPANMVETLDDQLYRHQSPALAYPGTPAPAQNNWTPWGQPYAQPNASEVAQSLANLSLASIPPPPPLGLPASLTPSTPPTHSRTNSETQTPSLTAPLPSLSQLQQAAPVIQSPTHDPALKLSWIRDVLFLVDRAQNATSSSTPDGSSTTSNDPPSGPATLTEPLGSLAQLAATTLLALTAPYTAPNIPKGTPAPPYIPECIYHLGLLTLSGSFPSLIPPSPRTAFRLFESSARPSPPSTPFPTAWFRLGRSYESFADAPHALECYTRGVKLSSENCLYRLGMAHLLGQLGLAPDPAKALPLLHRAATLASLQCPQPAYVFALLLLGQFTLPQGTLPPSLFGPYLLPPPSPHQSSLDALLPLTARHHLERAAFLHFSPALYKLGHSYEFAEPPFPFDPLLSVQYYSLASQLGEPEADMALSKWFLCGSGGAASSSTPGSSDPSHFEKDEPLALLFARKAATHTPPLPSALFALGYYAEVGVGQPPNLVEARSWYIKALDAGNEDARERVGSVERALAVAAQGAVGAVGAQGQGGGLTRKDHEGLTQATVVRKHTMAKERSDRLGLTSPPGYGGSFPPVPSLGQQGPYGAPAPAPAPRRDGRSVVDNIRRNSAWGAPSSGAGGLPPGAAPPQPQSQAPGGYQGGRPQNARHDSSSAYSLHQPPPPQPQPSYSQPSPPQPQPQPPAPSAPTGSGGGRLEKLRKQNPNAPSSIGAGSPPIGSPPSRPGTASQSYSHSHNQHNQNLGYSLPTPPQSTPPQSAPLGSGGPGQGQGQGQGIPPNQTVRPASAPNSGPGKPGKGGAGQGGGQGAYGKPGQAQTFADLGFHGSKVEEKDCVVM